MRFAQIAAVATLAFLGLGAIAGSIPMIADPIGAKWHIMPLSMLQHSPFHSYLIPGIILLGANGLLALWVLVLVAKRKPRHGLWTAFQGCVLLGWLVVECWMLQLVMWAHYFYGALAVLLIVAGMAMRRNPVGTPPHG